MRSISTSEYAQRRQQLMQRMTPNSIAILPAAAALNTRIGNTVTFSTYLVLLSQKQYWC